MQIQWLRQSGHLGGVTYWPPDLRLTNRVGGEDRRLTIEALIATNAYVCKNSRRN